MFVVQYQNAKLEFSNAYQMPKKLVYHYMITNKEKYGDKYLPLPRLCELLRNTIQTLEKESFAEMWGLASNRSYLLTKSRLKTKPPSLG